MSPRRIRSCVLYARISKSTEESVSIERQLKSGRDYANARGWKVIGEFTDDGVSATKNKPEDRKGWQALLATPGFDAVVIWKVDRLARRTIDFLHANEALKAKGAAITAVEDNIDMTTTQGEGFATMLAVFGQMEAAATRDRVKAARNTLLRTHRYPGGKLLYGYRKIKNPDGPGWALTHDEERIDYVREMVRRTLAGYTIYSTMQWLNEVGAPTPNGTPQWRYLAVDRIVRHPLLAGMIPHNPGRAEQARAGRVPEKVRGEEVLRDQNGLPVVDEALAVMEPGEWRAMQARLAEPNGRKAPRALRRKHSGVLSGLMWCGDPSHPEPLRMYRGTLGTTERPRPSFYCKVCHQAISSVEELIVAEFLAQRGDVIRLQMVQQVVEGGSVQLQEASVRLAELGREIVNATPDRAAEIVGEMSRLKEVQEEAKAQPATVEWRPVGEDRTFREDWESATTDEERRAIIGGALDRVIVTRGARGARSDAAKLARCEFVWMPAGDRIEEMTDEDLGRLALATEAESPGRRA